ncbi:hypothetical protein [Mucilaginibacter pocheonensis]|uniref:Uncharacterized protein n=1 Tax=Mucilaginibacter pocheonensis TaxID=398050 RepID=A0ABU1T8C4_9SPHI|nr:hypothetical protein [Mucilaginibacter pocheonensis]MDR6941634.1 hypothetical protein [Mucilaginibacter pocheonensis]
MKLFSAVFFLLFFWSATFAQKVRNTNSSSSWHKIIQILNKPISEDDQMIEPDSLGSAALEYEELSTEAIEKLKHRNNKQSSNIITYNGNDGLRLAYYSARFDKWLSVLLPFSTGPSEINWVNLDKKAQPELVIKGEVLKYGTGGGTTDYVMLILNVEDKPIQLLKITYGWGEESFGDKEHNGVGSYNHDIIRRAAITENGLFLSSDPNSKTGDYDIPNGRYVLVDGKIISANEVDFVKDNEKVLLQFNTQAGKRLVLAIDSNNKYLVYRYGSQNHVELQYPRDLDNSFSLFKYAYKSKNAGVINSNFGYSQLHFSNIEFTYNIYNQYDRMGSITRIGLIVTNNKTHKKTLIQGNLKSLKGQLSDLTNIPAIKLQNEDILDVYD